MKKVKNAKLSFKKETVSVLNDNTMKTINGGGFLSLLGKSCVKKICLRESSIPGAYGSSCPPNEL